VLRVIGKFFASFLLVFFTFYCRASLPPHLSENRLKTHANDNHIPVVFVPGIKGSILKDRNGSIQWLTAGQALAFSTPDLRLAGATRELIPSGAIARVTAIPRVIDVDLYGPWLERMSQVEGIDFYVFSYDWRKDNLNNRDKLILFLDEIQKKYSMKPVLIGHSMGGMLSFSALNEKPDLVQRVVLVGVPFRGGIGYMKDLYSGNATGLNSKIQSPCMIAKYESVYGFFPRLDSIDSQGLVLDHSGGVLPIDFFKESAWRENSLGFYGQKCKPEDVPSALDFQNILSRAKQFRESLDLSQKLIKSSPKMLLVHAQNRPTRKAFKKTEKGWDMEIVPREKGDGSVLFEHSIPQPGLSYEKILTENEHSVMLNDKLVQERILTFLKN
jgi:pimeloyl-ACP methyl ester carboxylesterase